MTTATYQVCETANAMSAAQAIAPTRLQACVALFIGMLDRQRQRRALLDLDNHLLNDIGKSRQEALEEARKPFWK